MSAPVLWIFLPLAISVILWLLQSREHLTARLGSAAAFFLAFLAWVIPIGAIRLGPLAFRINPSFFILGRSLTLDNQDRPFLLLIFLLAGAWFLLSRMAGANRLFVPLGMGMVGFLVSALAVEPFLYAALFIEIAVLFSIPILAPPGRPVRQGLLRYLIFQTLGMPFILFTGWMLTGVEAGSSDLTQIVRASAMLGLGFAFLLAVFPFYTWIPLLAEEAHPYETGFLLSLLPTVILIFGLTFIDRYSWLRESENLYLGLRIIGTVMIVTGGIWGAFQQHLGRMFGYGVILETGFLLLAAGLPVVIGPQLFAMLLLSRAIGLGLWSLALSVLIQRVGSLQFEALRGCGWRLPWAASGLVLANFSIAGLPLLADFPLKQALVEAIGQHSGNLAFWIILGSLGMMAGGLRTLGVLIRSTETGPARIQITETRLQWAVLSLGIAVLIFIGIFPGAILPGMLRLIEAFEHLV